MDDQHVLNLSTNTVRGAAVQAYLEQFNQKYPTDQDALEAIYRGLHEGGISRCAHCDSKRIILNSKWRFAKCRDCQMLTRYTAGTFFHRIRRPRAWLFAIGLFEQGLVISANQFRQLMGIAYASAQGIYKKIAAVAEPLLDENAAEISSEHFLQVMCKRSKETPAREHPQAEQTMLDEKELEKAVDTTTSSSPSDNNNNNNNNSNNECDGNVTGLSPQDAKVYACIQTEPINFDSLVAKLKIPAGQLSSTLIILEIEGLITRKPGDCFVRREAPRPKKRKPSATISTNTQTVNAFIFYVFTGVSRKYLQHYMSYYWFLADGGRWRTNTLFQLCLNADYINGRELRDYVSEPMLRVPQMSPLLS